MKFKDLRKKNNKNNNKTIYLLLLFLLFFFLMLRGNSIYKDEMNKIDKNLYRAAKNLEQFLGKDHNFYNMNKNSYTNEEVLKNSMEIRKLSKINNVDYLYTIIIEDGMPTYTSFSGTSKWIKNKETSKLYWQTFEEIGDNSIEETVKAFNSEKVYYINSSDDLEDYRSVYLMVTSKDGRKYIAGADMTITNLKRSVINRLFSLTMYTLLLLIISAISLLIISDNIKKQIKLKEIIMNKNSIDEFTGALKREEGLKEIQRNIELKPLRNEKIFLGLFDIVDMSYINDKFGITVGDNMIKKLSGLLKLTFRRADTIVRLKGDQFLIAIREPLDGESKEELEKRFYKFLKKYDLEKKRKFHLSVRTIFLEWDQNKDLNFTLNILFEKLRYKKRDDRKEIVILELDIQRGLYKNEFEIYYQPKVDIKTKNIEFEALMRWNHEEKGLILPGEFIHIAENSSLIISLTEFLIEQVKKDIQLLKTKVSINISHNYFDRKLFLEEITNKYTDLNNIEFELAEENFILDIKDSIEKIKTLKNLGINCLIDDFCTGYSSFSSLSSLPITTLKVDRFFVTNMFRSDKDETIIKSIIELGNTLGLKVIVEGIEQKKELDFLIKMGVNNFQGYYFGKPERLEIVLEKLKNKVYLENLNY